MKVRDVMQEGFRSVRPETTFREAAALFLELGKGLGEGGVPSLIVLDGGRLVGIVTLTDMVKALLPPYLLQDPRLAHMTWDGLLESQCEKAQNRTVREIMTQRVVTVSENAVLAEAVELLLSHDIHSVPVLRDNQVVGILYLSDLARRVFARFTAETR
jgi:CBS domain-containing protein